MSDTSFTIHGDEPVEARIVSWVLGEASAFEAAELERLCEERPELLVFRRRMLALHSLLAEAEAAQPDESWKLPPEKRKALDEIFGEEKPVSLNVESEKRIRHSGRRALLAIAACLVLTLVVLRFFHAGLVIPESTRESPVIANYSAAPAVSERYLQEANKAELADAGAGSVSLESKKSAAPAAPAVPMSRAVRVAEAERQSAPSDSFADGGTPSVTTAPTAGKRPKAKPVVMGGKMVRREELSKSSSRTAGMDVAGRPEEQSLASRDMDAKPVAGASDELRSSFARGADLGDVESATRRFRRAAKDVSRMDQLAQVDSSWELSVPMDAESKDADRQDKIVPSDPEITEFEGFINYGDAIESAKSEYLFRGKDLGKDKAKPAPVPLVDLMEEIAASEDPYSTFSLNISDASFKIAQAALAKGEQPDPAGIKVEQFYNAVDYGDPAPSAGEPVAVRIEQAASPVIPGRNLVRIALKTAAAGRSAAQPLRLTLLVDQSGSMVREDRRAAMNKALAGLGGLLTGNDQVTVIGFSRTPRLLADGMTGDKAGNLADLVNQAASEGGTNLEEAIKLAGQKAMSRKLAGAQNRIVLFTDGAANLGDADPDRLAEKVKALRQQGISFDIAGIVADGLNDELLGELARNGNGRYYVVGKGGDDDFAKQLAGAFRPAAENVKVQVHFNPERVGRYKLIGFEKDRLKTEDFRNDAVDAAELAAEEAGVAIYQVEPLPGGNGELGEVSVRFKDTASDQMVERSWTIPHDRSAQTIDRASPSMQLAVLSMLAGEKLKGGPLADAIDFKQLTESRASVKHYYGNTGRAGEMLQMVDALK